jgi:hypothetical protein
MKTRLPILFLMLSTLVPYQLHASVEWNSPPESLEELVETSDLVVVGSVKEILDNSIFYGYQESAEELARLDKQTPIPLGIYKTDFLLKVSQFIKGRYLVENSKKIVLRVTSPNKLANIESIKDGMKTKPGKIQKQVFFLRKNPDDTYSINSIIGAMIFKKTIVVDKAGKPVEKIIVKFNNKEYLPYGIDVDADEFIGAIQYFADEN